MVEGREDVKCPLPVGPAGGGVAESVPGVAEPAEGVCLAPAVAEIAGQLKRPLVALHGPAVLTDFQASVCLFSNEIVLYGLDTSLSFPNDVQDPRLTSMQFVVRDEIVHLSPTDKDGYSELRVTFCTDPAQPSTCQRYLHRLGLIFNPAWVYPFSVFERLS